MKIRWTPRLLFVFLIPILLIAASCQKSPTGSTTGDPDQNDLDKHPHSYATFDEVSRLARGTRMVLWLNREETAVRKVDVEFESTYDFEYQRLILCRTPDDLPVGSGDSGSPLYLDDGRVAGLLCYGYEGTSHQFAARTVEDVFTVDDGNSDLGKSAASFLRPIEPVGFSSRIDPVYLERMKSVDRYGFFERLGRARSVFSASAAAKAAAPSADSLSPGMSIAVFEISGDLLNLGAIGTLGAFDGDRLYAFGHRYSDFPTPLAAPCVLASTAAFVDAALQSFKYAVPTQDTVGAFTGQSGYGILIRRDMASKTFPSDAVVQVGADSPYLFSHRVVNTESVSYEKYLAALTASYAIYVQVPTFPESDSLFAVSEVRMRFEHSTIDTLFTIAGTQTIDVDVFSFIADSLKLTGSEGHMRDFQAAVRVSDKRGVSILDRR
jgi:hypothetical protein